MSVYLYILAGTEDFAKTLRLAGISTDPECMIKVASGSRSKLAKAIRESPQYKKWRKVGRT